MLKKLRISLDTSARVLSEVSEDPDLKFFLTFARRWKKATRGALSAPYNNSALSLSGGQRRPAEPARGISDRTSVAAGIGCAFRAVCLRDKGGIIFA